QEYLRALTEVNNLEEQRKKKQKEILDNIQQQNMGLKMLYESAQALGGAMSANLDTSVKFAADFGKRTIGGPGANLNIPDIVKKNRETIDTQMNVNDVLRISVLKKLKDLEYLPEESEKKMAAKEELA